MPAARGLGRQPSGLPVTATGSGSGCRAAPSGPMMDTPPPRNRVAADEGPNRGTGAGPEGGSAHRPGKVTLPDARPEDAGIVCPPCVPRDCPPRLCPEDAPRAARPAAHAVTWPGLDRGWGRHIGGKNAVHCLLFCLPFSDGVKTATTRTPPSRNPCPFSTVSLLSPF